MVIRVVIHRGRGRGYVDMEGCSEDYMYLFHFSILDTFILVHGSCDHFCHTLYFSSLYMLMYVIHLSFHLLFLFLLYTYVSYTCMQSIISISHKDALMGFIESVSEIQVVKVYLP